MYGRVAAPYSATFPRNDTFSKSTKTFFSNRFGLLLVRILFCVPLSLDWNGVSGPIRGAVIRGWGIRGSGLEVEELEALELAAQELEAWELEVEESEARELEAQELEAQELVTQELAGSRN